MHVLALAHPRFSCCLRTLGAGGWFLLFINLCRRRQHPPLAKSLMRLVSLSSKAKLRYGKVDRETERDRERVLNTRKHNSLASNFHSRTLTQSHSPNHTLALSPCGRSTTSWTWMPLAGCRVCCGCCLTAGSCTATASLSRAKPSQRTSKT